MLVFEVYLKDLKEKYRRTIEVREDIKLKDFCEYIIVSMNGSVNMLYQIDFNDKITYYSDGWDKEVDDFSDEDWIDDISLNELKIKNKDNITLFYGNNYFCEWEIVIKLKEKNDNIVVEDFLILDGSGIGLFEHKYLNTISFRSLFDSKTPKRRKEELLERCKITKEMLKESFDIVNNNNRIQGYKDKIIQRNSPKHYIMNVNLDGMEKLIKRQIIVNGDVSLDFFCRYIIRSMNGDLSHAYTLKRGKDYIDDGIMRDMDINYLELVEKQRLAVIYDYGDCWNFKISISKIIEGNKDKDFEVLKATGKGIMDYCGGVSGFIGFD